MGHSPRLAGVALNVLAPETLAAFYTDCLGMTVTRTGPEVRVGYGREDGFVALRRSRSGEPYRHDRAHRYWKVGITLPNLDLAVAQLRAGGCDVTEPHQFEDIGYLCHLSDPEGFQIEFLQHTFEGKPRTSAGEEALPLGGGARLGQVTLRTGDIDAELRNYRDRMGMKLLSIQSVDRYGFVLYFLGFTGEDPPVPDLHSVRNRPWLWQRPYTVLELQHVPNAASHAFDRDTRGTGFAELVIMT